MILGVVGTGIANILFFKLIQISSPVCHFGNLFDTGCSFWGLDNEMLTAIQFLGALVILVGVYLSAKNSESCFELVLF
jgi:drug/metabolite transporter (DMT)-like permease